MRSFRGRATRQLDDEARRAAPGSFLQLRYGLTHYERAGPQTGRCVILVHGFSVPSWIWDPTFRALDAAGFHVIRYDLYGRGFTDRPRARYDVTLFVEQLTGLLDGLGIQTASLIGLSMGGPIVATFGARHSQRTEKIVLIDPSGVRPIPLGLLRLMACAPAMSAALLRMAGQEYLVRTIAKDFFAPALVEEFQARYREQMQYDGFLQAVLATIRDGMLGDFESTYTELGRAGKPILVFWGERDRTVPFAHSAILKTLLPQAAFVAIPDAGHVPHYERPSTVTPPLISFLKGHA